VSESIDVALSIGSALLDSVDEPYRLESQTLSVESPISVEACMTQIGLSTDRSLLIVLNDTMVRRPDIGSRLLANGDRLALMPPIHAG